MNNGLFCNLSKDKLMQLSSIGIKFISARRVAILKNNIEVDAKVKCIENGITQAQIAEKSETSSSYVNQIIKKSEVLNKTFI